MSASASRPLYFERRCHAQRCFGTRAPFAWLTSLRLFGSGACLTSAPFVWAHFAGLVRQQHFSDVPVDRSRVEGRARTASISDQHPTFVHPEYSREPGD